jgi:uncharacterized membrane protein
VNRYVVLYLATLIVLIPIDFLFLGTVARGFFSSEVGDMLGEIGLAPAIVLYVVGILIFVSGQPGAIFAIDAALWRAVRIFFATRPSNSRRCRCSNPGPGRWSWSM